MKRVIAVQDAVAMIPEGATIMIGGFMGCGNTHGILDALARSGKGGFTVICNDGAMLQGPDGSECYGVAKLIRNRQVKRLIATHVGLNPEVAQQMNEGTLQVDLLPQGSFVEMIRAGGAGLGGRADADRIQHDCGGFGIRSFRGGCGWKILPADAPAACRCCADFRL